MAAIDELNAKIDELTAEVAAQSSQVDEVIVTLQELKALLGGPDPTAAILAATARIDAQVAALKAKRGELDIAEEGADPTPDTP